MAFSYDLSSANASIVLISQVRFFLGDTVEDSGVFPDGGNIQDDAILMALSLTGDDPQAAAAALYRPIATRWAAMVDVTVGPRKESNSQAAARWQALADASVSAGAAGGGISYVATPIRDDGYYQAEGLQ